MGAPKHRRRRAFDLAAGFTAADDRLPAFFAQEPLSPTGTVFDVPGSSLDSTGIDGGTDGELRESSCPGDRGLAGCGRAVALKFPARARTWRSIYRSDEAGAQETVEQIVASAGRRLFVQADIAWPVELRHMVAGLEDSIGPIEVLINKAAAFNRTHFLDLSLDEFDAVWATNGRGFFYLSQLVARCMAPRGHGAIVHISSLLAQQTIPGRTAYAASKGAVESLTRAMALDAPHGIRVNASRRA